MSKFKIGDKVTWDMDDHGAICGVVVSMTMKDTAYCEYAPGKGELLNVSNLKLTPTEVGQRVSWMDWQFPVTLHGKIISLEGEEAPIIPEEDPGKDSPEVVNVKWLTLAPIGFAPPDLSQDQL